MALRELIKKISGPVPVISICTALLFVLCYLIVQSLSDDASGEMQLWITLLGSFGVVVLIFFLVTNGYSLYRQYSRDEMGSKLTAKLVMIFLLLTLIPLSLIYYFSIQFLNKGVDSWFDIRIEQAVQDALFLGQTSLQGVKDEVTSDVEKHAKSLLDESDLLRALDDIRDLGDYVELSLFADDGRILAFSRDDNLNILPDRPGEEVFSELRVNKTFTSLEPISNNTQQVRVVAKIDVQVLGREFYALQAVKLLPLSYANLASSVENALNQYDQMVFARGPLRFSLMLTLSLISLASLLFSILTAVYLTRRLVAPIAHLAEGTKMIADGSYGSQLPVTSADELGVLTASFNDMSSKISQAQYVASASQQETEQQKGYLETVLTQLSSGVLSFDSAQRLQVCNSAAADILGLNLDDAIGKTTGQLAAQHTSLDKFMSTIDAGLSSRQPEWQDEVTMLGTHGRQQLIVRGTLLLRSGDSLLDDAKQQNNYVVVFDDVTDLIQAQRDAAWGEVARRLAHEIKNPLTPIQLSAERIRSKFSQQTDPELQTVLERSTHTIVQQVEAMKEMVNAFSSYAQPVRATLIPVDMNQLIIDIIELHAASLQGVKVQLVLENRLPEIKANATALRQVINNLIINACHALEETEEGKLIISTDIAPQEQGNYIDLIIEDNGSGVPSDIRDSLFDPYVSSKAKGSGLGLAIVKRIVEEHSGSVSANDGEHGGTLMHVRLPVNAMQTYRGAKRQSVGKTD